MNRFLDPMGGSHRRLISDGRRLRPDTAYHNPTSGPVAPISVLPGSIAIAQPRVDSRLSPASINRDEPVTDLGGLQFSAKQRGGT